MKNKKIKRETIIGMVLGAFIGVYAWLNMFLVVGVAQYFISTGELGLAKGLLYLFLGSAFIGVVLLFMSVYYSFIDRKRNKKGVDVL